MSIWQDRNIITSPVYYSLVTNEKMLKSELKKLKCANAQISIPINKDATTSFLENDKKETCAIICLFDHSHEVEQIFSLLVHEAVHIFQEIKAVMGEKNPSSEFEAYSIQRISQNLFYEYKKQTKKETTMKKTVAKKPVKKALPPKKK